MRSMMNQGRVPLSPLSHPPSRPATSVQAWRIIKREKNIGLEISRGENWARLCRSRLWPGDANGDNQSFSLSYKFYQCQRSSA